MVIGETVAAISTSVADLATIDIQPAAGIEWIVQNIYAAGSIEVYWTDGTNNCGVADQLTGAGSLTNMTHRVTNGFYIQVKNVSGGAINIGYAGVITK